MDKVDTAGRVWHPAPKQSAPLQTASIQGLWLSPGEDVSWSWTHNPDGSSYVSGFSIRKASDEIQPIELPKQIKESLEALGAFRKAVVDSMAAPSRLMKKDDRKKS